MPGLGFRESSEIQLGLGLTGLCLRSQLKGYALDHSFIMPTYVTCPSLAIGGMFSIYRKHDFTAVRITQDRAHLVNFDN